MPKNHVAAKTFELSREPAGQEASKWTTERLAKEVAAKHGPRDEKSFTLAARDENGGLIGGINGVIHWRWLYIGQFYLLPDRRGNGLGRALLDAAEALARENACVGLYLDTFDPGALDFYRRCGFAVVGGIENFPPGAARSFLSKAL